jgi:flagellar biosynthesis protein FliR
MTDPLAMIATGGLVFCRTAGLVGTLPVFAAQGTPKHVPIFAALSVTLLVAPAIPLVEAPAHLGVLIAGVAGEIFLGATAGLTVRAVFAALAMGCEIMAMQMGLAIATMFNPLERQQAGPLGLMASWAAGLAFVANGLHLRCIEAVGVSFTHLPPGAWTGNLDFLTLFPAAVESTIVLGVQLAGPILGLVWLVNLLVAILARLAPKMNVFFSIGMTLTSVLGIWMLAMALPWILAVHGAAVETAVASLFRGL